MISKAKNILFGLCLVYAGTCLGRYYNNLLETTHSDNAKNPHITIKSKYGRVDITFNGKSDIADTLRMYSKDTIEKALRINIDSLFHTLSHQDTFSTYLFLDKEHLRQKKEIADEIKSGKKSFGNGLEEKTDGLIRKISEKSRQNIPYHSKI